MYDILSFVKWALTHVQPSSVPQMAQLALEPDKCGTDPWQYLFGSIRVETTDANLNRYYETHYKDQMTRAEFDKITSTWSRTGYATDCEGLLDAYLTYVEGVPTDMNADGNYRLWCSDKALISEDNKPYAIGEAVFRANDSGKMTHVGWVCGFQGSEPLIVEARNIRYGVVITKLSQRSFTHRALMTKLFEYKEEKMEPIRLELTTPVMRGDAILALQFALNELGYTDADGKQLEEDGKCGKRTLYAVEQFAKNQLEADTSAGDEPCFYIPSESGDYRLKVTIQTI